ncbi:hypothetical protein G7015_09555 [Pseudomonas kunmingensis]|uniref:hypothetical protein n=1 Tax=Stutzerimonas kunmingensis TaxID=1211807 RepID=UPI0015E3EEAF|nr:hypothetical protein [Stutzerimonas kunmingensis]MBA1238720.1 hypothetical protein [Stutzerimonas kunmingensis]
MTIQAKRAKALPVLDREVDWGTGGIVDERIPAAAEALIQDLESEISGELLDWFKRRIGRYRAYSEMADKSPATHEEVRLVREAQRYLLEVRQRLSNLPPSADAHVNAACWRRHNRLFHGTGGLLGDLDVLARETDTLLAIAEQELGRYPGSKGAKSKSARDSLLSDAAQYIRENSRNPITKRKAAETARDLLLAAGVSVPADVKEVERLLQRFREGGK